MNRPDVREQDLYQLCSCEKSSELIHFGDLKPGDLVYHTLDLDKQPGIVIAVVGYMHTILW